MILFKLHFSAYIFFWLDCDLFVLVYIMQKVKFECITQQETASNTILANKKGSKVHFPAITARFSFFYDAEFLLYS